MTKELQTFSNADFGEIRTVVIDNLPYFAGKDIATALGYVNPTKAVREHTDEEDRTVNEMFSVNGTPITLINESGLYSLILTSKLPSAKEFKRWVTASVLPMIRKTGVYAAGMEIKNDDTVTPMRLLSPDDYLSAARLVANCKSERLNLVLSLLSKGGWDIPHLTENATQRADTSDISDRIKRLRECTNISLQDLSRESGISVEVLRSYESGRRFPKQARYTTLVMLLDDLEERRKRTDDTPNDTAGA